MGYYRVVVKIERSHYVTADTEREARIKALQLLGIDDKTEGAIRVYVEQACGCGNMHPVGDKPPTCGWPAKDTI